MKGLIKIASLLTVAVILTSCMGGMGGDCCNPCPPKCCQPACCPQPHIWDNNSNCCGPDGSMGGMGY